MNTIIDLLPAPLMKEVLDGRAAIVGGSVRAYFENKTPRDIDIFFFDKDNYEQLVLELKCNKKDNGIHTFKWERLTIDLVLEEGCHSVEICCEKADFDIAGGCFSQNNFLLPYGFENAIRTRTMKLCNLQYPQKTFSRLMKYKQYGYTCSSDDVRTILLAWQDNQ